MWAEDFSFRYYERLLRACQRSASVLPLRAAAGESRPSAERSIYLRHDVDLSILRAVEMAERERALGVSATYMVIPGSRLYDLEDNREVLRHLETLGHEVGLHFDIPAEAAESSRSIADLERLIVEDLSRLEAVLGHRVDSISFHRPIDAYLHGPRSVCQRINAYARELMETYLSDSAGRWRGGEPLPIVEQSKARIMQVLVHPIWWGEEHQDPRDRLEEFFVGATSGMTPSEAAQFDASLSATVPNVIRRGAR